MPHALVRAGATLIVLLLAGLGAAHAELTRLEITSKQPFGSFAAGDYVIWQGKIHGDLAPEESIPARLRTSGGPVLGRPFRRRLRTRFRLGHRNEDAL